MRMLVFIVAAVLMSCSVAPRNEKLPQETDGTIVIYRKVLSNNRAIVMVRGPDLAPAALRDISPDLTLASAGVRGGDLLRKLGAGEELEPVRRVYQVRLELRSPNAPAITLFSHFVWEDKIGGFDVLDGLVADGQIVLAVGENGFAGLWRINNEQGAEYAPLGSQWMTSGALAPVGRKAVHLKLSWPDGGSVRMEIDDRRAEDLYRRSWYVQTSSDQWRFGCARAEFYPPDHQPPPVPWADKVVAPPAPPPAGSDRSEN